MDLLKELVTLITPNKLKKINLLSDMADDAKLKQLYIGYHEKQWKTDVEAASSLYGEDYKKDTFFKLKHDLTKKLIQIFPLVNITEDESWGHRKATWECFGACHTADLLIRLTPAVETARSLMEKVLPKCLKYEFTSLIVLIAEHLSAKYKIKKPNRKLAQYYDELAIEYATINLIETKGMLYLHDMYGYYLKDKSAKVFIPQKVEGYLKDLEQYSVKRTTQKITFIKKMLSVIHQMSQYNYRKTIEICDEALSFFESQTFVDRSNLRPFYFQAIASHAYCREFEKGYSKAERCLAIIQVGTYSWFKVYELFLQLALYSKQYQEAYRILRLVMKHERFSKLPEHIQQIWILYEGFIFVLKEMGKITVEDGVEMNLRFQSFINKLSIWSNDKKGINFSIRVLHLFYLIVKKEDKSLNDFIDRIEPLRQYARRYAKTEEMQRSRWIVDILDGIAKNGFSAKKITKDKTIQKAYESLVNVPYDITDANLDIEPMPFQDVYEYIEMILRDGVPRSNDVLVKA
jgi:transcription initiation factor IIE alpha subunit